MLATCVHAASTFRFESCCLFDPPRWCFADSSGCHAAPRAAAQCREECCRWRHHDRVYPQQKHTVVEGSDGYVEAYEWVGHALLARLGFRARAGEQQAVRSGLHPRTRREHRIFFQDGWGIFDVAEGIAALDLPVEVLRNAGMQLSPPSQLYADLARRRLGRYAAPECAIGCPGDYHGRSPNCLDTARVFRMLFGRAMPANISIANIGCGALAADPLAPVLQDLSSAGLGAATRGLCLEADSERLAESMQLLRDWGLPAVQGIATAVTPQNIGKLLASAPPPDVLKVDVDGMDCAVLTAALDGPWSSPPPALIIVEVGTLEVPPPYRFKRHFAATWPLPEWGETWKYHRLFMGCSLGYLVSELYGLGYFLYKYNGYDAIFVHRSRAATLEEADGIKFPLDELLCYLLASINLAAPIEYIQDWLGILPVGSAAASGAAADADEALARIWRNISEAQRRGRAEDMPFLLDLPAAYNHADSRW
eukprot:TRINITY_DN38948_c0_g1_i1.p2 TRINITY_DN38948_c0_g1~~TRINITY_DN38948_c0_g1_i1.p2  ORF type:complete len:480 (-),score=99.49 TRINITY_DN38948_c0_g1_i1:182-1621(-)